MGTEGDDDDAGGGEVGGGTDDEGTIVDPTEVSETGGAPGEKSSMSVAVIMLMFVLAGGIYDGGGSLTSELDDGDCVRSYSSGLSDDLRRVDRKLSTAVYLHYVRETAREVATVD